MAHSQQQRVSLILRGNLPRRQVEDDLGEIHVQMRPLTWTTCGTLCCAVQQKMMFWNEKWSNKMPEKNHVCSQSQRALLPKISFCGAVDFLNARP